MDNAEIHLADIREYATRLRKLAEIYEQLEDMAKRPGSNLPALLAKAGALVCEGIEERGTLLDILCSSYSAERSK